MGTPALNAQLRQLRKRRGLTLQEVADRIGTDHSHLSRVERGLAGVSLEMLQKFLYACDHRVGFLPIRVEDDVEGIQLKAIPEEHRRTITSFAAVYPQLPEPLQEEMQERIRAWVARYGGDPVG